MRHKGDGMKDATHKRTIRHRVLAAALLAVLPASASADLNMAQRPLILGDAAVPGNLFLVPSIEWPTMNSIANIGGYTPAREYVGYFNPNRCYVYHFAGNDPTDTEGNDDNRWQAVHGNGRDRVARGDVTCDGEAEWSGNFLNWAATQTIDPFRLALMGGYRFRDEPGETWLQKARHDGQGSQYPVRTVADADIIAGATPFEDAESIEIRVDRNDIEGVSDRSRSPMQFVVDDGSWDYDLPWFWRPESVEYDPDNDQFDHGDIAESSMPMNADVRVEVCIDDGIMRRDLCQDYGTGPKPEGLIQEFAALDNEDGSLRFSLFTYLNDDDSQRDGGVMRSPKKFVGPERLNIETGEIEDNPRKEWDPDTGVLLENPDPHLADATSDEFGVDIERSGLINYLGMAGQTNTNDYKSHDPVSELYYAMSRYFRGLGPVEAYHDLPGNTGANVEQALDDFPVVTREGDDHWDDPIADYFCAPSAGLSILDVFTHRDKNLPGNAPGDGYARGDEPDYWDELAEDHNQTGLDVVEMTNRIGIIDEDIHTDSLGESVFTGRENSAYMAGLAYELNTRDQRPEFTGRQTLQSYMVDVVENQDLEPEGRNIAYLTAKYGGFDVPPGFDPDSQSEPLDEGLWTEGESVSVPDSSTTIDNRPTNYFLGNEAEGMVAGLREAFERLAAEETGSAAAVAANTTEASDDTLLYQARFDSLDWSGDIVAFGLDAEGEVDDTDVAWRAVDGITTGGGRSVYVSDGDGGAEAAELGNINSLPTTDQQNALDGDSDLMDYLLFGVDDDEQPDGPLRERPQTVLGDIVNSAPFVTFGGTFGYQVLDVDDGGGDDYRDHLEHKEELPNMLYVGANDGMLHAFTAEDGEEQFTFMPDAAFDELARLAEPGYDHRFYVDGQIEVADAYVNGDWTKTLVASTGAGNPAVFSLDVTDPENFGAGDVNWEVTPDEIPEMGHVLEDINIVRLNNGEFAAVFGNGYNSADHEPALIIVPITDNPNPTVVELPPGNHGSQSDPNGLGGVSTVDAQGNGTIDFVYAGDLHGNMWRFDLTDESTSQWSAERLFQAEGPNNERQPITAAPRVIQHSAQGVDWNVLFGTGKFFEEGDDLVGDDPEVHSFYAIQDAGSEVDRGDLLTQEIEDENRDGEPPTRVLTDEPIPADKEGWHVDLVSPDEGAEGEQVIDMPEIVDERVFFLTQIPEGEVCGFGGRSWIMEMDAESGGHTPTELLPEDSEVGGIGFDQMATGLTRLRGEGTMTFYPSLGDGSIESVTVPEFGDVPAGRQSWEELR